MCLAQGHNAVTLERLEPAAPRSRVKHSTTEPLCSLALNEMVLLSSQTFVVSWFVMVISSLDFSKVVDQYVFFYFKI